MILLISCTDVFLNWPIFTLNIFQSLSNTCTPILTKPKPKPKEQPPEKNKEEKNGENNTTDKGEEAKKEEKPDDQNKAEQEANSPEMDLDWFGYPS